MTIAPWFYPALLALIFFGVSTFLPKLAMGTLSPLHVGVYSNVFFSVGAILMTAFRGFDIGFDLKGVLLSLAIGVVGAIGTDTRFGRRRSRRYKSTSFICAPLLVSNELAGLITITMKRGDGAAPGVSEARADLSTAGILPATGSRLEVGGTGTAFTGDELRVLSILAGHAASAIENLRLYHELKDFNRQLEERVARATEELSHANRRLAQLQAFQESILTNIPLGVLTFDPQFTVTYRNQVVVDLAETSGAGPLLGQPVAHLFERLEVDRAHCPWQRSLAAVVASGAPAQFVRVACRSERVADFHATPLRDGAGQIVGGLLTIEDTTRKLAMERKLANTERMASVGQLAARVAHELNNPLDGIMRFINLAIRVQPPDSPAVKYLQQSRTGLMRMVAIIRDLLKFSRSTFGALETTQVNQLVEEAVKCLASKAASQGIEVRTQYADGLTPVRAGNLFQVFYNLMTNAIDAMPDGGTLTLATRAGEGFTEISVADTGVGIPEALSEKIFEPFFTTKEAGKGTGLGLAICRDIVQKHEGTLTFTTSEGRGSAFLVRIPVEL